MLAVKWTAPADVAKEEENPREAFVVLGPRTGSMRARALKGKQAHERMSSDHASGPGDGSFGNTARASGKPQRPRRDLVNPIGEIPKRL
jgi:hypothetical protein